MGFGLANIDVGNVLGGIGTVAKDIRTAIKGYELTPDQQAEIEGKLADLEARTLEAQASVVIAEAKGNFLQKSWRPMLMLLFGLIIANNYVIYPYLSMFTEHAKILDIPPDMWSLLKIGVGGYIVGRSAEKGIRTWKEK